jgi:hypothetical protein
MQAADRARIALAAIRTANGVAGLVVPAAMARRMGANPDVNGAPLYPLRLFGIRTVLLGVDLLLLSGEQRRRALRAGLIIHATDTLSAITAGVRKEVPAQFAVTATAISATNTVLAAVALRGAER